MEATVTSDSKNIPCSKEKQVLEQNNVKPQKHLGRIKSHLLQLSWSKYGHLQVNQDAQGPLKPEFECFQGWNILSGQLAPAFPHSHFEKFLPYILSESILFSWKQCSFVLLPLSPCPTSQFFPPPSPLINVEEPVLFLYPRVSLPLFHLVSISIMWCLLILRC